jgi:hypothetical protein
MAMKTLTNRMIQAALSSARTVATGRDIVRQGFVPARLSFSGRPHGRGGHEPNDRMRVATFSGPDAPRAGRLDGPATPRWARYCRPQLSRLMAMQSAA